MTWNLPDYSKNTGKSYAGEFGDVAHDDGGASKHARAVKDVYAPEGNGRV